MCVCVCVCVHVCVREREREMDGGDTIQVPITAESLKSGDCCW